MQINVRCLLLFCTLFSVAGAVAQPQTNNWFFTGLNGLNFSSGEPVNILNGKINTPEGGSAISDENGNLLFYTDGIKVWDRTHAVMPDGQGLRGGTGSSTQSALVIPALNGENKYYVFTVDESGSIAGLQYALVDMDQRQGLGSVILKNQQLLQPTTEKLTAVKHCNGKDYWIIVHEYDSDAYYSYLLTKDGVDPNPVISHTGSSTSGTFPSTGIMRASPDGKWIAAAIGRIGIELSEFNNQTGAISNTQKILDDREALPYGAEFSLNSGKLYTTENFMQDANSVRYAAVFQYDMTQPGIAAIIASKVEIFRVNQTNGISGGMGTLQRARNGKIYIVKENEFYLSVINEPELQGASCTFVERGVQLHSQAWLSLPNFLNDYPANDTFSIVAPARCINIPVQFSYVPPPGVTSLQWNFGDPASGANNVAFGPSVIHTFSHPGPYTVELVKATPCGNDTIRKQLLIGQLTVHLGMDTALCAEIPYALVPKINSTLSTTYLWQDGSSGNNLTVSQPGLYYVQVQNACGTSRDSIRIEAENCRLYVPSAFTPNNDGLNDQFRALGTNLLDDFDMRIFNRYGQLLWQTNNTNRSWNGEYKGRLSNSGSYVYIIRYSEKNSSETKIKKGSFLLIR